MNFSADKPNLTHNRSHLSYYIITSHPIMPGPVVLQHQAIKPPATFPTDQQSSIMQIDDETAPQPSIATAQHSFSEIGPAKLRSANIMPNNQNKIFARFSLYASHPIKLNLMPRGKWGINEALNMLTNQSAGLGIATPAIPKSLLSPGDSSTNSLDAEICSKLDNVMSTHHWLNCDQTPKSDISLSTIILREASNISKTIQSSYRSSHLLPSWADILQSDTAITGVQCNDSTTTVSLIIDCGNKHIAFLVALHLQAWACIADVAAELSAKARHAIGHDKPNEANNPPWSHSGSRSKDRRSVKKRTDQRICSSVKAALTSIDSDPLSLEYKWLALTPSTALSVAYSCVQFSKARWTSASIRGLPWSDYQYSSNALINCEAMKQWRAESLDFEHHLSFGDARPTPNMAIWLPLSQTYKLPIIMSALNSKFPSSYLVTSIRSTNNKHNRSFDSIVINSDSAKSLSNNQSYTVLSSNLHQRSYASILHTSCRVPPKVHAAKRDTAAANPTSINPRVTNNKIDEHTSVHSKVRSLQQQLDHALARLAQLQPTYTVPAIQPVASQLSKPAKRRANKKRKLSESIDNKSPNHPTPSAVTNSSPAANATAHNVPHIADNTHKTFDSMSARLTEITNTLTKLTVCIASFHRDLATVSANQSDVGAGSIK